MPLKITVKHPKCSDCRLQTLSKPSFVSRDFVTLTLELFFFSQVLHLKLYTHFKDLFAMTSFKKTPVYLLAATASLSFANTFVPAQAADYYSEGMYRLTDASTVYYLNYSDKVCHVQNGEQVGLFGGWGSVQVKPAGTDLFAGRDANRNQVSPCTNTANIRILESDHFEIAIIQDYELIYHDAGSGADTNLSVLNPKVPDGFKILGHVAIPHHNFLSGSSMNPSTKEDWPYTIAIKAKSGSEHLLAKPERYDWIYDDRGTGADMSLVISKPQCKTGFVALGHIAGVWGNHEKYASAFTCVKSENVVFGTWEVPDKSSASNLIWKDSGSGGDFNAYLWRTFPANSRKDSFVMAPLTFQHTGWGLPPDRTDARIMNFQFTDLPNPMEGLEPQVANSLQLPKLLGRNGSIADIPYTNIIEYKLPFFLVDDPRYLSKLDQWMNSPYYTVKRSSRYEPLPGYGERNTTSRPMALDIAEGVSVTEEENWFTEFGFSLGISQSAGIEAGGFSAGVEVSMEASVNTGWGGSTSWTVERGKSRSYEIPPGAYGTVFALKNKFEFFDINGTKLTNIGQPSQYDFSEMIYVQYPAVTRPDILASEFVLESQKMRGEYVSVSKNNDANSDNVLTPSRSSASSFMTRYAVTNSNASDCFSYEYQGAKGSYLRAHSNGQVSVANPDSLTESEKSELVFCPRFDYDDNEQTFILESRKYGTLVSIDEMSKQIELRQYDSSDLGKFTFLHRN